MSTWRGVTVVPTVDVVVSYEVVTLGRDDIIITVMTMITPTPTAMMITASLNLIITPRS